MGGFIFFIKDKNSWYNDYLIKSLDVIDFRMDYFFREVIVYYLIDW